MSEDCLFCKIVAGEIPSDKVYETDSIYAFRDINPAAPTHVLVIPKKHIKDLASVESSDSSLMGEVLLSARTIATQEGLAGGYRVVTNNGSDGGQAVFHIHFHLLGGRKMSWPPG